MKSQEPQEPPEDDTNTSKPPEDDLDFDELMGEAKQGKLTEESLHEKLTAYQKAIEEEYTLKNTAAGQNQDAAEKIAANTREFFRNNVGICAAQIVHLAHNSTSDSVRATCCKFVVQQVLDDVLANDDPIRQLMQDLRKNDKVNPLPHSAD